MDGEFKRARWQGGPAILNQRVCKIVPSNGDLHEGYLFYFLPAALRAIEEATPFVTVKHLSVKSIQEIRIPLPPLSEQRRIAQILDRADELRAKRRAALAELDTLTQSIFLEMFGDPVRNPKGCPAFPFSEVAIFENGDRSKNYPSGDDIQEAGILFLSTKNIVHDRLDLTSAVFITKGKFDSLSRGKAKRMDLIITLRGTLGSCCIYDCQYDTAFINAQMMIIRPKDVLLPQYLHALITSKSSKDRFQRIGNGVAIPQLTATQLSCIQIPVPPLELQREFVHRLLVVEKLKVAQRASLGELDALFASFQHRAFRGEL